MLPLHGLLSLMGEDSAVTHLAGFPMPSQLTFKAPGSKSSWLYKLTEFSPSDFQSQMPWDLSGPCGVPGVIICFSPLPARAAPRGLSPSPSSVLPALRCAVSWVVCVGVLSSWVHGPG